MNNDIDEDEVFAKKETSKTGMLLKNFFGQKRNIGICVGLLIIIVLVVLQSTNGIFSNLFYGGNGTGNSVGNINNCGYANSKGNYIYYVAPSEDPSEMTTNIYRVKKGEDKGEVIYKGNYDIRSLNIIGNQIYFISVSYDETKTDATGNDSIDNKIYKMNLDGSDATIINDNEFAYDTYDMYAVNNKIYYVGIDYNIYKMNLDGSNKEKVIETENGMLAINKNYIIYNKENEDSSDFVTCISKINGTDEREINGSRIYTPDFYNGYIYYINNSQQVARQPIKGGNEEVIHEKPIYNMNIHDGYIYYLDYKDENSGNYAVSVYRISVNGGEAELIKDLSYYASFLDITDGYIYYMDMDDEKSFINLINLKDKSEKELYHWNYDNSDETNEELPENSASSINEILEINNELEESNNKVSE